jgi:aminodeoxyfutalosine deaminase
VARRAVAFRDRGVVGLGVGGLEGKVAPGHHARTFAIARDGGLGSVSHAGEVGGAASVRSETRCTPSGPTASATGSGPSTASGCRGSPR